MFLPKTALPSILLFIIPLLSNVSLASSLLGWFDWKNTVSSNPGSSDGIKRHQENDITNVPEDITLISVPFEEMSAEDKFLLEAERFSRVSLSGLDTCEHRVVLKIQTSCTDMTEEELAKLSINLLNCQLEVSGRSQVTCTDDMSLKECTSPMDDETWNAYHIINNRARAVCYATRQQQFRILSEMTVNKLMSSALKQVTSMESLKELQKELNLLTSETMSSLKAEQKGLADQNSGIQLTQRKIMDDISNNIKQLTKEKTLIQNTQTQLDSLSRKLSYQFDEAESRLGTQSELHQQTHEQILSHLKDITQKADILWKLLENKSEKVIKQQDEVQKRMQEALDNLSKINCSVNYLKSLVDQVKADVDSKIMWATTAIGLWTVSIISPVCWLAFNKYKAGSIKSSKHSKTHGEEEEEELEDDKSSTKSSTRSENSSRSHSIIDNGLSYNKLDHNEDSISLSSLRHRSSPTGHSICAAVCRNGQLCRSSVTPGRKFCKRHISH